MTGMCAHDISIKTGIKLNSVYYIKKKIMKKIGAKNNNELIIWFLSNRKDFINLSLEDRALRYPFLKRNP